MNNANKKWLEYCPEPRPRPADITWDVFLSYRSINRPWVLALYDTLTEAGFKVFLDQFELVPGASLDISLQQNLETSGAGILVWSKDSDSTWVQREHTAMRVLTDRRATTSLPFERVVAKLDDSELPLMLADSLYVDFASYPEGPRGGELLRLMHGMVGLSLSEGAVRAIAQLDEESKDQLATIQAAVNNGFPEDIVEAAQNGGEAWNATAMLISQAAEALNSLNEHQKALDVIALYKNQFDESIRLQHMEALAHRRLGDYKSALKALGKLYVEGHRDPETLGIYGAALVDRYKDSGDKSYLEKSQYMYADAFIADPTNYYAGVNAASKAVLLGLGPEVYQPIAEQVNQLPEVQNPDIEDYWAMATAAEVKLLLHDFDGAVNAYRDAVRRHSEQKGSISSTFQQLKQLLAVLDVPVGKRTSLIECLDSQG